ncbi:hypothetical protein D1872_62480 [compost metagenome]
MPADKNFFVANPKEFTVSNGSRVVTIKLYWPLVYGDPNMNMAKNQADIIASIFNSYFQGLDMIAGARALNDKQVVLQGFPVGASSKLIIDGKDKDFFFSQTTYSGTDEDTSKNRQFTVSDGTNTTTIVLNWKYNNIEGLASRINDYLSAEPSLQAVAEQVDDDTFQIKSTNTGASAILEVGGANQTEFFNQQIFRGEDEKQNASREFTVSDGTKTATILLNGNYSSIEGLVQTVNMQLEAGAVRVQAEKVDVQHFALRATAAGVQLIGGGTHWNELFTD